MDGTQKRWSQNAYHKAEDLNDDDDASLHGRKIDEGAQSDVKVSTIIGTEANIVSQVSSWNPTGIKWVRVELRAQR